MSPVGDMGKRASASYPFTTGKIVTLNFVDPYGSSRIRSTVSLISFSRRTACLP